jgi:hypothetical protein
MAFIWNFQYAEIVRNFNNMIPTLVNYYWHASFKVLWILILLNSLFNGSHFQNLRSVVMRQIPSEDYTWNLFKNSFSSFFKHLNKQLLSVRICIALDQQLINQIHYLKRGLLDFLIFNKILTLHEILWKW